jgi:peptidoglycan/xylan/chitin deacetylase (PgdA/CDA1 family)
MSAGAISQTASIVLMYHRVGEDAFDPFGLAVEPRRFRAQLERLGRLADVVTLEALMSAPPRGRPRVALTFDDGYLDNLEAAAPELERAGLPATLFAISGRLGAGEECWWDQLEQLFRAGWDGEREIELEVPERGIQIGGGLSSDPSMLRELHGLLLKLPPADIYPLLDSLREQLGAGEPVLERRLMSAAELRRLDAGSCFAVGAHTRSHPNLVVLSAEEQLAELRGSRLELEAILGRAIDSCSYPYGSYDAVTLDAVAAAGFSYACTATPPQGSGGPGAALTIGRHNVENWDAYGFESRLREWLR